jgi:hypothetical protein
MPFNAQRVGQVQLRFAGLENVGGPVPAVGGFDHHVRTRAGLGDGRGQCQGVVVDLHGAQLLAVGAHAHDDRSATVQIDADIL